MALRLAVAVGAGCLLDARVTHLSLDPSEVGPVLQEPGGVGVSGGVVLPVGEPGLRYEWLPDGLQEIAIADDMALGRGEDELTAALCWSIAMGSQSSDGLCLSSKIVAAQVATFCGFSRCSSRTSP